MHELDRPTEYCSEETPCSRLDEIIADYLEAVETGNAPPREKLLADHPELAEELKAFFADQDRLDAVVAPLVGRSSTNGSGRRSVTAPLPVGQRIGRYELLEELGRGGMGIVYKARQLGANRIVALKMIAAGAWATPDELKRFRLEAETIAELDHPNIVPLHEVGEEDGRAFYSMKWIEGGSLAGQIERLRRQPREAVRLLLAVARAIHHAHQHGVLHRDLKPANILLGETADKSSSPSLIPYVSDFGLAKKLAISELSNGDQTIPGAPTLSGTALGTPSYMAPEQARNARLATTTADVYSLGAILYECLTGRPPFRASTSLETLLDVLEREPPKPSTIRPGLDHDLDTICLKCLRKEPEKRYASAAALADDLERYLAGEPILARPTGPGERFLRWCRRQPVVAGLIAAVLVTALAGVVLVVYQWREAEEQRAEAVSAGEQVKVHLAEVIEERGKAVAARKEAEGALADAKRERADADDAYRKAHNVVKQFCLRLSEEQLSHYAALMPLRKQLLSSGLAHLESFRQRMENDPRFRRDLADTLLGIGQVSGALGSHSEAVEAFQNALAVYRTLHTDEPTEVEHELRLVRTLSQISSHQAALGRTGEARMSLAEAKDIQDGLAKRFPKDAGIKSGLAALLNNLRALNGDEGRGKLDPTQSGQEVVDIRKKLLEQFPDSEEHQASLALAWYNLGLTHNSLRRPDEARRCWEEARTLQDRLVDRHGDQPRHRRDLAQTCRQLANWHTGRKEMPEALRIYEKARQLLVELTHDYPLVIDYQSQLASVHADLGSAYLRNTQGAKALAEMNTALEMRKKAVDLQPMDVHLQTALGQSYYNLGNLHRLEVRNADSLDSYRKAEETFRKLVKQNPDSAVNRRYLAGALNNMADVLQKVNRSAEALKSFEECVALQKMVFDASPKDKEYRESLSMYSRNLSRAYRLDRRHAEAVAVTLQQRDLWLDNGTELARLLRDFQLAAQLTAKNSPEWKRYVDYGIETLAMALAAGYRDFERLRTDPDLALFRQRDEFERLLRTHEMR
jgi:serine/threonine-protein kinase